VKSIAAYPGRAVEILLLPVKKTPELARRTIEPLVAAGELHPVEIQRHEDLSFEAAHLQEGVIDAMDSPKILLPVLVSAA
jgi:hypothetical protein